MNFRSEHYDHERKFLKAIATFPEIKIKSLAYVCFPDASEDVHAFNEEGVALDPELPVASVGKQVGDQLVAKIYWYPTVPPEVARVVPPPPIPAPGVASGAPPTARPGGGDGMPGSSSGPDAPPVAAVPKVTVTVMQGRKKEPVLFDAGKTIADFKSHLEKNPVGLKGTVTAARMTFLDGNKEPMPDETVIDKDMVVLITLSNAYLKREASSTDSEAPAAKKQREGKDFMKKVFEGHPINTDLELDMVRAEKYLLQCQFYYHQRQGHREVSCDISEKLKVLNLAIRNLLQHQDTRVNLLMNHERRATETSVGFDQAMHLASEALTQVTEAFRNMEQLSSTAAQDAYSAP